ncbi:hypothetical protein [Psychrobacter okhotskensis]|uniref:hypothetical protein n=1 Tax=Psychrobacter okhotskensis TaxID=212403 RepID=UPI003F56A53A
MNTLSLPSLVVRFLQHSSPWGSIELYKVKFKFTDDDGNPYSHVHYRAVSEVKELIYFGTTNAEGETANLVSSIEENFNVHLYLSTIGD